MEFLITLIEGIISFISPCMLPMLPIYVSYFAAGAKSRRQAFARALAFVVGFTLIFCLMGLSMGAVGGLGGFVRSHKRLVEIVCGAVIILFGLSYLEVIPLPFLKGVQKAPSGFSILSAFVFGLVYSVSLTPCIGAFLGSALMQALNAGTAGKGILLLLTYSLGLGLPFLLSALLLERLQGAFGWIKRHYRIINLICGSFLILTGVLMAAGLLGKLLSHLS